MPTAGLLLSNGCRVTHGSGANIKTPFADVPVTLHELYAGDTAAGATTFRGQFGFIAFTAALRLPRHVHIGEGAGGARKLLAERILVVNGAALTELNGEVFLVGSGSLVDIAPGVPHTWTACPPGVTMPDGSVSDGTFLMIYEYSEPTGFFPIAEFPTLDDAEAYKPFAGDLEAIRFPELSAEDVLERTYLVWDKDLRRTNDVAA